MARLSPLTAPRLRRFVHPQPTLWSLRRCSSLFLLALFLESGPDRGSLSLPVELEVCDGAVEVVAHVAQGDHE